MDDKRPAFGSSAFFLVRCPKCDGHVQVGFYGGPRYACGECGTEYTVQICLVEDGGRATP